MQGREFRCRELEEQEWETGHRDLKMRLIYEKAKPEHYKPDLGKPIPLPAYQNPETRFWQPEDRDKTYKIEDQR